MIRRTGKTLVLALALLAPAATAPLVARGQDDGKDEPQPARPERRRRPAPSREQQSERAPALEARVTVKDGKVRVRFTGRDGRLYERELTADDFFSRLFGDDDWSELDGSLQRLGKDGRLEDLEKRIDGLRERLSRLARPRAGGDDEDDKSVLDDIEKTLKTLPKKIERALDDMKKDLDPDKAKAIEKEIRGRLRDILDSIRDDDGGDRVKVKVGDREMSVPKKKGKAQLY